MTLPGEFEEIVAPFVPPAFAWPAAFEELPRGGVALCWPLTGGVYAGSPLCCPAFVWVVAVESGGGCPWLEPPEVVDPPAPLEPPPVIALVAPPPGVAESEPAPDAVPVE